jgi:hypothetical protein
LVPNIGICLFFDIIGVWIKIGIKIGIVGVGVKVGIIGIGIIGVGIAVVGIVGT